MDGGMTIKRPDVELRPAMLSNDAFEMAETDNQSQIRYTLVLRRISSIRIKIYCDGAINSALGTHHKK